MNRFEPITPQQRAFLEEFTCQRLSDDPANAVAIQDFQSKRGRRLVSNLRINGWNQDKKGQTAYYVVKDRKGRVVLFFSLRCGVLFDKDALMDFIEQFRDEQLQEIWQRFKDKDPGAVRYFRRILDSYGQDHYDFLMDNLELLDSIKLDKRDEPKMVRVFESHPAVELVEFCADDRARKQWRKCGMSNRGLGQTMFWWFIVPIMLQISRLAGSEYAFLFAADTDPDGSLVLYYEEELHFSKLPALGTVKPLYDLNCYFMGKRLHSIQGSYNDLDEMKIDGDLWGLEDYRKDFFDNFNLVPGADTSA